MTAGTPEVTSLHGNLDDGPAGSTGPTAFILGPARSGTSLLYKALCLHPDAAYISNWLARFPRVPQVSVLDRLARRAPERARRSWFWEDTNAYVYGRPRSVLQRAFPSPVEGEPVYTHAGVARPGGPRPRDVAPERALPRAFGSIRRYGGGTTLVSKRIANNLRIPQLDAACPSARFVELVRDGRAVALSLSRVDWWEDSYVWWYRDSPRAWRAEGRDPWAICAENWVEEIRAIRAGLHDVSEDRVLRLRYEDLIRDAIPTVRRVGEFVGLRPDPRWDRALASLTFSDRSDIWRTRLDPAVVDRITDIQRDELERHGYL